MVISRSHLNTIDRNFKDIVMSLRAFWWAILGLFFSIFVLPNCRGQSIEINLNVRLLSVVMIRNLPSVCF